MNRDQLIGAVLGVIGALLILIMLGFWPLLGIFLMLWGNNLERSSRKRPWRDL